MKYRLLPVTLVIASVGLPLEAPAQVPVRVEQKIPVTITPKTYPLVCRGTRSLSVSVRPERIGLLIFERGTGPAAAGLQPGQCSWRDRGVSASEPNVVAHYVPPGADREPPYLWPEALWNPDAYWTFEVYNDGQGSLVATHAYAMATAASGTPLKIELPFSREFQLRPADLAALERKLATFASGLNESEGRVWKQLLRNAALAPRGDPRGVLVQPVLNRPGTPGGPTPDHVLGIIVQGGREAIGPKQDDPAPPPPSAVAIGARGEDRSRSGVARKLLEFSAGLSEEERAGLDWLLSRASMGGQRPGTPGGAPPELTPSLRQALGIDPVAIGPKQDDPRPPAPDAIWVIRY